MTLILAPRLTAAGATRALRAKADPNIATLLARFFRTGPGEYGEGDRFLGVKVPTVRALARDFLALPFPEVAKLLPSPFHEARLLAVVILTERARRAADEAARRRICRFYLRHARRVNNWDLVDVSAPTLVGPFLHGFAGPSIERFSRSRNLWERRISVLAFQNHLRRGDTARFYVFATRFLDDPEDLIHKAVGWMLRVAGDNDPQGLRRFLRTHEGRVPRTMLRYAIEKFPERERRTFLVAPLRARAAAL